MRKTNYRTINISTIRNTQFIGLFMGRLNRCEIACDVVGDIATCNSNPRQWGKFAISMADWNKLYLSYVNDFLTVEKFAEYHNLSLEKANGIILVCQSLMNN